MFTMSELTLVSISAEASFDPVLADFGLVLLGFCFWFSERVSHRPRVRILGVQ